MRLTVQVTVLFLLALHATLAAEESCAGRCSRFDSQWKCQCDSMCVYHRSCCHDFQTACRKKSTRGDTFNVAEDAAVTITTSASPVTAAPPTPATRAPATRAPPRGPRHTGPRHTGPRHTGPRHTGPRHTGPRHAGPRHTGPRHTGPRHAGPATRAPSSDPDAVPCSGRPFDAFLQLKNGSIYAFRGEYFFELDESSVLPENPKLIVDVWGIPGPIDAAFTRINCQGKTYIFKGNRYWRFEGDVLDDNYPRNISVGFDGMPDDVNAAFAIPAPSFSGREKAYFFKGDEYHQYDFKHQPSHEECVVMTRSSPSVMFTHYTDLYYDQLLEELFAQLFSGPFQGQNKGPRLISRDWLGVKPPVDAAMRGRHSRSLSYFMDDILSSSEYLYDYNGDGHGDYEEYQAAAAPLASNAVPVQSVYFFHSDKYWRVNLGTKRVDRTAPRYPRSIATYWLGCGESADLSEKRK
ncbi:hypothetical protein NHX12_010722 [Muraenolepis orangiensis]|uniref:SMB domain-containing protein n=1 Tax=Muraenolepis orangiensis TaxID=630683 RepID=A0A9Q0DKC3_9TELE|nr:hypothetical protein NHX12_010722 [Muraenolepis orangiensis]